MGMTNIGYASETAVVAGVGTSSGFPNGRSLRQAWKSVCGEGVGSFDGGNTLAAITMIAANSHENDRTAAGCYMYDLLLPRVCLR